MPPAAPSNLQATATSPTTIALTWTDNATTETGFVVERATSGSGPWTVIANPSADATSAISHSLTPGTTHHFRVKAVNAGGDSAYTATVSATTTTGPLASDGFSDTDYPAANVNLAGLNPTRPGFSGAWFSSSGNFLTRSGGLTYTDGTRPLTTEGKHIGNSANARTGRLLDTTPTGPFAPWLSGTEIGADGQTLYLSFLMKIDSNGFNALELHRVNSSDSNRRFFLGRHSTTSTTDFSVNANGSTSTLGTLNTDTNLFVVKIEFGAGTTAGNERVTVWRNPTDLSGEGSNTPAAILTNVPSFTFDRMHLAGFSSGTSQFDEIRFGHAWSAVTPHTGGQPPLTPLEQWLTTAGFPLDTDLTTDPSGGGVPLLIRYALGLAPSGDVSASLPQLQVSGISPQPSYLTLSFTPAVVNGLNYIIEASSDLTNWTETHDITASLTAGQPHTFTDPEPISDNLRRFLRLRISQP